LYARATIIAATIASMSVAIPSKSRRKMASPRLPVGESEWLIRLMTLAFGAR
jgi:hypothetical protein